jgi:hypothetical protein
VVSLDLYWHAASYVFVCFERFCDLLSVRSDPCGSASDMVGLIVKLTVVFCNEV